MADALRRGTEIHLLDAGHRRDVTVLHHDGIEVVLSQGGRVVRGAVERRGKRLFVHFRGVVWELDVVSGAARAQSGPAAASELFAPMTGTVVQVFVKDGESVAAGAPLLIVEAMKMEHRIVAPVGAKVVRIHVKKGTLVDLGAPLVSLKLETDAA